MSRLITPVERVYRHAGLWVPKPLRFASRRCCCPCPCTDACTGTTPRELTLTISGVEVRDIETPLCSEDDCLSLNDTFTLQCPGPDFTPAGPGDACTWGYELPSTICWYYDWQYILFWLYYDGQGQASETASVVLATDSVGSITWTASPSVPMDCSTMDITLNYYSGNWCELSSSSAQVTS